MAAIEVLDLTVDDPPINEQPKDAEGEEFHQSFIFWDEMFPELRTHVLSFCPNKSLYNYAQTAKWSNEEIKIFNSAPPAKIVLSDVDDGRRGISVSVSYEYSEELYYNIIVRFTDVGQDKYCLNLRKYRNNDAILQEVTIEDGDAITGAIAYCNHMFRYIKNTPVKQLDIQTKEWPVEMLKLKIVNSVVEWRVNMLFNKMESLLAYPKPIHKLMLVGNPILPPGFFHSRFFKQLKKFVCHGEVQITDEEFLDNDNIAEIHADLSGFTVNAKIKNWLRKRGENGFSVVARRPLLEMAVFQNLTVGRNPMNRQLTLLRNDGKMAKIWMSPRMITFIVDNSLPLLSREEMFAMLPELALQYV